MSLMQAREWPYNPIHPPRILRILLNVDTSHTNQSTNTCPFAIKTNQSNQKIYYKWRVDLHMFTASAITYQGRLYSQNTRLFLDHLGFLRYQDGLTDHLGLIRSVISWCGKMAGLFGHMDIHTSSATCLSKTRSTRFQGDQIPRQSPKIIWEECSLCLLNEANIRDTTS